MRATRKLIAMLLAAALIAAGCGGDDDDDEAGGDTGAGGEAAEVETDFGVTDDTIRVGLLADLSGPFAALVSDIVTAGWADPAIGQNVLETYTNYCLEAMNALQFMADEGAESVAIATFPGEYGQDAAAGAKMAADELGLEIVYDGEGKVTPPTPTNPTPDNSAVAQAIVDANPDWVWVTVNPSTLATLMGQAAARGFGGKWSGSSPSYNDLLLTSEVAELIDSSYWISNYTVTTGTDVPGMQEMIDTIKAYDADARTSDAYVYGWTEAQITDAILRQAADNGDMTRAGVTAAAFEVDVDFGGLAPDQNWQGDPNDYIVRESYIFKPVLADYNQAPLGEGSTGSELVQGPFASDLAQNYNYEGPCFTPQG